MLDVSTIFSQLMNLLTCRIINTWFSCYISLKKVDRIQILYSMSTNFCSRFATEPHCDLAEQFTFYGVSGREGAARRFNLDFYCKAFGIDSPKAHGVTGMDVNTLLGEKRFREIAEYCLRDVRATVELYRIWKERLAGIK